MDNKMEKVLFVLKSLKKKLVRISIVLFLVLLLLALSYGSCLLLELEFLPILVKCQSMLLGRAIRSIFTSLGWPFLGLLLSSLLSAFSSSILNMMAPEGAGGAPAPINIPIGGVVMGPDAPDVDFGIRRISSVLRGCQRINLRRDVLHRIIEDLRLYQASADKRIFINQVLAQMEDNRELFLGLNANRLPVAHYLTVSVSDWERGILNPNENP